MRPPALRIHAEEMIVDNFAGGGGASLGLEWATGRSPDVAVNHDPEAIAMHQANHPRTRHFCEDVFAVDPREVCGSRGIALAWFSPDCTYYSKARGGKPFRDRDAARRRRGLAGVVIRWASLPNPKKPRVILLENVEEFQQWGPLDANGLPDPLRRGMSFRRWLAQLRNCGYEVELRQLTACDYGAPTKRKRLFVIARSDGRPIVWPRPTHGRGLIPHRSAAECMEWSLPVPSIFGRKKPLAENTQRRIARGVFKYVLGDREPFIVPLTHHGERRGHPVSSLFPTITGAHRGELALVDPVLVAAGMIHRGNGERETQAPRIYDLEDPHPTVVAGGIKTGLVTAFLARHYGGPRQVDGASLQMPLPTVTATDHHAYVTSHLLKLRGGLKDHHTTAQAMSEPAPTITASGTHLAEVRAFLVKYYGNERDGAQLGLPMPTVVTKDRLGLVTVDGQVHALADICMRMLVPPELFRAQGFPRTYILDPLFNGRPLTKTTQVRLCGNSVNPDIARDLAIAQLSDNPVGIESGAA